MITQLLSSVLSKGCALLVLMMSLWPAYADAATIYRCKLADGRYQYQQEPCADKEVKGETAGHRAWHDMRALSVEGEKILQRLGPSVESIKQCRVDMRKFQDKINRVNNLLKQVNAQQHPMLFKSYGYLQECAECRTSAASACQLANGFLDQAQIDLMKTK